MSPVNEPKPRPTPVYRRRRNSARLALYGGLAVVGVLLVVLLSTMRTSLEFGIQTSWNDVDWASYPDVRLLQQYVRINTAEPPEGDPLAGARWLAGQLISMGLVPVIEEVGGQANVWAVLEGEEREAVVLHSHMDIDPVYREEDWEHPPFSGVIDGPWIYGRGTFDMKSVTIAQLSAMRRLVESGRRPEKSVIFLATTGEEVGSDLGTKWILRNHPELVERFGVVLTEGGVVEGRSLEDFKFWGTEFVQKRMMDVFLCGPDAAIDELVQELRRVQRWTDEPRVVPEVELFFRQYAPTRDAEDLREWLSDPHALVRNRPVFESLPHYLKSFFRNEINPYGVYPVAGGRELRLRALLLPGEDPEEVLADLLPPWRRHGLTMQVFDEGGASHGSPVEHWAFRGIDRVMGEEWPEVPHGPLVLTLSGSDARFFRAAGLPTYGFSPFAILTPHVMQLRGHATINERMPLIGLVEGVDLYGEVLAELAGMGESEPGDR